MGPQSGGKAQSYPSPATPPAPAGRIHRPRTAGPSPAPLRSQPLSCPAGAVTEVKTDIYVTSFGPVSDVEMVRAPARRPCSVFPGFITVASELTVIKADYEA